ncbi:MAG: sugar ABC transporter ATP-binding protein [Verrucomicrobiota bacterium]
MVPDLSVRENLFLGRERGRLGFVDRSTERREAEHWLSQVGVKIDPEARCRDLSIAQQQAVEIARALSFDSKVMVMDEPTAVLTEREVDRMLELIDELRERGIGVLLVTHKLAEIERVADRYVVLRDGEVVDRGEMEEVERRHLIEKMVGRTMDQEFPARREPDPGEVRLRVSGLSRADLVKDVSFSVRAGDVLGIAGLVGSGRTETLRLIAGIDHYDAGRIEIDGTLLESGDPRRAIARGVCLLTEDRKSEGLILDHSLLENFGLPSLDRLSRAGWLMREQEHTSYRQLAKEVDLRATGPSQLAGQLSGGNQQKLVFAKWLAVDADIFLIDEPTRGIDVGAKYEIYQWIYELAARGKAVVMVSSELPEILAISDRILVMHEGRICGQIEDPSLATPESILALAVDRSEETEPPH